MTDTERLQKLVSERDAANQAAHQLALKMDWEAVAEIDKALAVGVLTARDRIPFTEAYRQVFEERA
jgi:hypothetical protein